MVERLADLAEKLQHAMEEDLHLNRSDLKTVARTPFNQVLNDVANRLTVADQKENGGTAIEKRSKARIDELDGQLEAYLRESSSIIGDLGLLTAATRDLGKEVLKKRSIGVRSAMKKSTAKLERRIVSYGDTAPMYRLPNSVDGSTIPTPQPPVMAGSRNQVAAPPEVKKENTESTSPSQVGSGPDQQPRSQQNSEPRSAAMTPEFLKFSGGAAPHEPFASHGAGAVRPATLTFPTLASKAKRLDVIGENDVLGPGDPADTHVVATWAHSTPTLVWLLEVEDLAELAPDQQGRPPRLVFAERAERSKAAQRAREMGKPRLMTR